MMSITREILNPSLYTEKMMGCWMARGFSPA